MPASLSSEVSEFPSLVSPELDAARLRAELREHLRCARLLLCGLAQQPETDAKAAQGHLANLDAAYAFTQEGPPSAGGDAVLEISPERRQKLGQRLRQQRDALKLSVERLAKRAGLAAGTIKRVERGETTSRATLLHLANVPELGLDLDDLLYEADAQPAADKTLNCYIAPEFDPVKSVIELGAQLNGPGGYIEQTNMYLDHQSAAAYLSMANDPDYITAFRDCIPLDKIATQVVASTGRAGIDLIALGAGDAREEVRLVQNLASLSRQPDLRLYLLDISQPLLSVGFKHAADKLHDRYGIAYFAMQGNFHHLPRYTQLHYTPERSHRRRLVCILGRTMANLEDEPRFFRHTLVGCAPGDLLLLDMQLAYAPASQPEEIMRKDPALRSTLPKSVADWLAGPIWRHCRNVAEVTFDIELTTQCPIPGCYSLDAVATVRRAGKPERRFSMQRYRRYDPDQVVECLHKLGWEALANLRYGSAKAPAAVMLFRKGG